MLLNKNARALVYALRSGDYEQTTKALHRVDPLGIGKDGYCCLGVACAIAAKAGIVYRVEKGQYGSKTIVRYDDKGAFLPKSVMEWLNFSTPAGDYTDTEGNNQYLGGDNDIRKLTFHQIADIIESNPKGLCAE